MGKPNYTEEQIVVCTGQLVYRWAIPALSRTDGQKPGWIE
jgi:hypothetical protein